MILLTYISKFKEELIRQEKSGNTISSYIRDAETFTQWLGQNYDKQFDGIIKAKEVEAYKEFLLKKYKPATVSRKLKILSVFNKYLVAIGVGEQVKVENIKIENNESEKKNVNEENYNKLKQEFYNIGNKRDIAVFEMISSVGVKVGDLIEVETEDLCLDDKEPYILFKGNGNKKIKTKISGDVKNAIENYLKVRQVSVHKNLFLGHRGKMERSSINKLLSKYCDSAGIERVSPSNLANCQQPTTLKG